MFILSMKSTPLSRLQSSCWVMPSFYWDSVGGCIVQVYRILKISKTLSYGFSPQWTLTYLLKEQIYHALTITNYTSPHCILLELTYHAPHWIILKSLSCSSLDYVCRLFRHSALCGLSRELKHNSIKLFPFPTGVVNISMIILINVISYISSWWSGEIW